MSGLIDTIVRRRRASARSRLGPPADALERVPWLHETAAVPEPEPVDPQPEPEPVDPQPEPEPEPEPEPPEPEATEPEPVVEHLEPDPAEPEAVEPDEVDQPTASFTALRAAAPAPAEIPSATESEPYEYPPLRERVALRRRARHLAAIREVQLRDLGGLLLELHRLGHRRADLVRAKLAAAAATDAEWRELHHRLDEEAPIGELRVPGIGGACPRCGAVHGSADRFCASCGERL